MYQTQQTYTSQASQSKSPLATSGFISATGAAQTPTSNYGATGGYPIGGAGSYGASSEAQAGGAGAYGTSSGVQGGGAGTYGASSEVQGGAGGYGASSGVQGGTAGGYGSYGNYGTSSDVQGGTGGYGTTSVTYGGTGAGAIGNVSSYSTYSVSGTGNAPAADVNSYDRQYSYSSTHYNPLGTSGGYQVGGTAPITYTSTSQPNAGAAGYTTSGTYGTTSGTYGGTSGTYGTTNQNIPYTTSAQPTTQANQSSYTVRDPSTYTSTYTAAGNTEYQTPVKSGYDVVDITKVSGVSGQRQVQSMPVKPVAETRQSILTPYRNTMYPEFEIVEDLPDRNNLINSINILLQKSPQRESLLTSPSKISITRKSMLSPAEIDVQSLLKEKLEDGSLYEGEGRNGVRHGRGKLIYKDGRVFEGEFVDGKAVGTGVFIYKNGKVCYQGGVNDGRYEGQGVLQCDAPTPAQTDFNHQDFGKLGNTWTRYEGEFKNGKRHGNGTVFLTSGEKFIGEFRDDKVHGRGTFHTRDGRAIQGNWEDNIFRS